LDLPCKKENIGEENSFLNYMPRPIKIPSNSQKKVEKQKNVQELSNEQ
jgi:hypothetical protein